MSIQCCEPRTNLLLSTQKAEICLKFFHSFNLEHLLKTTNEVQASENFILKAVSTKTNELTYILYTQRIDVQEL